MADKLPSEETGTFSIHNSSKDRDRIQYLGLEGVGGSKIWTRALKKWEKLERIKEKREQFYSSHGEATLGELLNEINKL